MTVNFTEEDLKRLGFKQKSERRWIPDVRNNSRAEKNDQPKRDTRGRPKAKNRHENAPKGRFRCSYAFHVERRLDWMNLCFMIKVFEDKLVTNGIMYDDHPKYMDWPEVTQELVKKGEKVRVEIKVFKISETS